MKNDIKTAEKIFFNVFKSFTQNTFKENTKTQINIKRDLKRIDKKRIKSFKDLKNIENLNFISKKVYMFNKENQY